MFDLLKVALRQRPEYILVGEIRGEEAHVLFQAMTTGHAAYSTMHADSTKSLIPIFKRFPLECNLSMKSIPIRFTSYFASGTNCLCC